ncbi:MAG: putative Ig domain-containing protein [Planctomycetes bacterium]|nr:putative Ig domain-containing protein [Planctomycetota bacterium]
MKSVMVFTIITVLGAAAYAQSGSWNRTGPYVHPTEHATTLFDSKLWVLGGVQEDGFKGSSVAYSSDGATWSIANGAAPWAGRKDHAVVAFQSRLWVFGGDNGLRLRDIWSSPDGITWTQHGTGAPWNIRSGHSVVEHGGELWLMGGSAGSAGPFRNDIWSSPDGVNWTQRPDAPWAGRTEHQCVSFNGRVWVIGGRDATHSMNDVWSSPDGINWVQSSNTAGLTPRSGHIVAGSATQLWLYGGVDESGQNLTDVWTSPDGAVWTLVQTTTTWSPRAGQSGAFFNGKLWIVGGDDNGIPNRDAWTSSDGTGWSLASQSASWSARWDHTLESFNGRLWVVGGTYMDGLMPGTGTAVSAQDIWSSPDGGIWTREVAVAPWGKRTKHQSAVFNNRMWILGGVSNGIANDVWSTVDGVNWVQETAAAPWPPRMYFDVVVFNNRMWVLGGSRANYLVQGDEFKNDVWSTADGVNWVQETASAAWAPRYKHSATVFNNKIWVMGGWQDSLGTGNVLLNDVWSSTDGINWTMETAAAAWPVRCKHSSISHGGHMWVFGGDDHFINSARPTSDVWTSTDGTNWTQQPDAPWPARRSHASVIFNNRLMVAGGSDLGPYGDVWALDLDTPPVITSTPQPAVSVGSLYRYAVHASGAPSPVISAAGLPSWMSLTGRTLHGTPTLADVGTTGTITITATNTYGTVDQQFQVSVMLGPVITSTAPLTARANNAYTYQIVAGGTPAPTYSVTGLPGWLSLNGDTLMGVPSAADIGWTGVIIVIATNSSGTDSQSFQIDVQGVPPQITSTPVYSINEGRSYLYTITATGTPAPVLAVTGLPSWLGFDPATGAFSGTPAHTDIGLSSVITVTASNGWGPDAVQVFTINVEPELKDGGGGSGGGGCVAGQGGLVPVLLVLLALVAHRRRRRA